MTDLMFSKTILVTGTTGFIGSHLVKRLVADDWDVHVIIRSNSNILPLKQVIEKITAHEYDGTSECMNEIIEKAKPKIVIHLASLFLAQHSPKDIEPLISSNILFGTQLVEAMVSNGVYSLINTGTSWQHYENSDYNPVCLYAATKQAFETILTYYTQASNLKTVTLKLYDTFGPDDPRPKLFSLLKKVANEEQPLSMSPGEQKIDIVYIDDVIEAFMLASNRLLSGKVNDSETYAVSSGDPIKLRELVEIYSKVIGKKLPIEWGGRPYRNREVMIPWNNGSALPGWTPRVSLEEGIKRIEQRSDTFEQFIVN